MMNPVHIGIPIRKRPWNRGNIIVAVVLATVGLASAGLTLALKERSAGELITAAALAVGF